MQTIEASLREMGGAQATPEDQEKLAEVWIYFLCACLSVVPKAIRISLEEEDKRLARQREESQREEQEMELAMFRSVVCLAPHTCPLTLVTIGRTLAYRWSGRDSCSTYASSAFLMKTLSSACKPHTATWPRLSTS